MSHVIAVLGLSLVCALWFLLQRHAPEGCNHSGACGACRHRDEPGEGCANRAADTH